MNLVDKRICITGGKGFSGCHLVNRFKEQGYGNVFVADIDKYDFRKLEEVIRMYEEIKSDIVIHLAARVGGIGANREHPGEFFYDNLTMGVFLMEQARLKKVEKFVALGTICCYSKFTPVPFKYVEDCAEAIVLSIERYNISNSVNVGAGFEISNND